jgi:hypothetical protein
MKISSRMVVVVSRASHVHHVPQVGRPQIDPAAIANAVKRTPISAEECAIASCRSQRRARYRMLVTNTTKKAR